MFPISLLPRWTYPFSIVLSPTWGISAMRKTVTGSIEGLWLDIVIIIVLSLVYLVGARILFREIDIQARKTGQLVFY